MTQVILQNANASPWSVPSDWGDPGSVIELVGPGGDGNTLAATTGASWVSSNGGAGGGYLKLTWSSGVLTPGTGTVAFQIPTHNGTTGSTAQDNNATSWLGSSPPTNCYLAQAGAKAGGTAGGTAPPGGTGRVSGTVTITYTTVSKAGGSGGISGAAVTSSGGGGGGGAGPNGIGGAGGNSTAAGTCGGGGGGGNNGGAGGIGLVGAGGAGGSGVGGAGGAGGIAASAPGKSATAGRGAGGGGGFASGTASQLSVGGTASTDTQYSGAVGIGGGGGGGGANSVNTAGATTSGGNGGLGGGGGGGPAGSRSATSTRASGVGGAGFIIINYSPTVYANAPARLEFTGNQSTQVPARLELLKGVSTGGNASKALLHFDGPDASTTITDSAGPVLWTAGGNAQLDDTQYVFGGTSLRLDPLLTASHDYVFGNGGVAFGTNDFTVDFWLRSTANGIQSNQFTLTSLNNGVIFVDTGSHISFFAASATQITGTTTLTLNVWHHIALTRQNSTHRLFLDGVLQGSAWTNSIDYGTAAAGSPSIGANPGAGGPFTTGWIDEFRILLGTAAWTNNFTPPTVPYSGLAGSFWPIEFLKTVAQPNVFGFNGSVISAGAIASIAAISGSPIAGDDLSIVPQFTPYPKTNPIELLATAVVVAGTVTQRARLNIEALSGVAARPGARAEVLASMRQLAPVRLEQLTQVQTPQSLFFIDGSMLDGGGVLGGTMGGQYIEVLLSAIAAARSNLEVLHGVSAAPRTNEEVLASASNVTARALLQLELLAGIRGGAGWRTEFLANLRGAGGLQDEFLSNLRASGGDRLEYLASLRAVGGPQSEFLHGLVGGGGQPLESLHGLANGLRAYAELAANLRAGGGLQDEILANARAQSGERLEYLLSVAGQSRANAEIISGVLNVTGLARLNLELLAGIRAGVGAQAEFLANLRRAGGDPLEFLAGLAARQRAAAEYLLSVSAQARTNEEITATVNLVTALSRLNLELLANVRGAGYPTRLEQLLSVAMPATTTDTSGLGGIGVFSISDFAIAGGILGTPFTPRMQQLELLSALASSSRLPAEYLLSAQATTRTNEEIISSVLNVTGLSRLNLELLANLRGSVGGRLEALLNVRGSGGDALELLHGLIGNPRLAAELTANLATAPWRGNVEALLNARAVLGPRLENLLSVAWRAPTQDEILSSVQNVTALSRLNLELLGNTNVTGLSRVPLEQLAAIAGRPVTQAEFLANIRAGLAQLPAEVLHSLVGNPRLVAEFLAGVAGQPRLRTEQLSGIAGRPPTQAELLANLRAGVAVLPAELLANVRTQGGGRIEQLTGVAGSPAVRLELTGNITSITQERDEFVANFRATVGSLRDEVLLSCRFTPGLRGEYTASVRGLENLPFEVVSTVRPLLARSSLPLELVINVQGGLQHLPFEYTGISALHRIDRIRLRGTFQTGYTFSGTFQTAHNLRGTYQVNILPLGKVRNP